jgi:hypothetical protein
VLTPFILAFSLPSCAGTEMEHRLQCEGCDSRRKLVCTAADTAWLAGAAPERPMHWADPPMQHLPRLQHLQRRVVAFFGVRWTKLSTPHAMYR